MTTDHREADPTRVGRAGVVDVERARPGPSTGDVVVVGGSGAVGRAVAAALAPHLPGRVVVAGRNGGTAWTWARRAGHGARPARMDVGRSEDVRRLADTARVVVMCVEAGNVAVATECLRRGVDVVDVSATAAVLEGIAALDAAARAAGATAVVSVGLAPGLTNLLARLAHGRVPGADRIDLTVGLGLGGDHGVDSRRWVVRALGAPVPAGAEAQSVDLAGFGRRVAHPFPFSDQHALSTALDLPVVTRVCFDGRVVTAALFALRRVGAFGGPRRRRVALALDRVVARLPLGGDRYVVQARAAGPGGAATAAVVGLGEADATGRIAAAAVRRLLARRVPPGVHHLDGIVDAPALLAEVGMTLVGDRDVGDQAAGRRRNPIVPPDLPRA